MRRRPDLFRELLLQASGQRTTVRYVTYAGFGAFPELCPADQTRVCLLVSCNLNPAWLVDAVSTPAGRGLNCGSQHPPLILTWRDHGALAQRQWYLSAGGAVVATVAELFIVQ